MTAVAEDVTAVGPADGAEAAGGVREAAVAATQAAPAGPVEATEMQVGPVVLAPEAGATPAVRVGLAATEMLGDPVVLAPEAADATVAGRALAPAGAATVIERRATGLAVRAGTSGASGVPSPSRCPSGRSPRG